MPRWLRVLRSPSEATRGLEIGDMAVAAALVWLMPLALGMLAMIGGYAVVAVESAMGSIVAASGVLFAAAYGLFLSPMMGLPALAAAGVAVWALIRLGWGGWPVLLIVGAFAGGGGFWLVYGAQEITGPALGLLYAGLYRVTLSRIRRDLFTTR